VTVATTPTARLDDALRLIDGWIGPQGVAGAGAAVWRGGRVVAERYAGEARPGVPVDARTIFALASVTKPVTAAVVMTLVQEGAVSLDEPVNRLVPEFAAGPGAGGEGVDRALENQRRTVTVRHLLAHTSGLPEDLGPHQSRYAEKLDIGTIVETLCRLPLKSAPGAQVRYSNAGFAVLARLVEHLTGEPFWDAARRRVLDPLGLADTVARPGPDLEPRLIHLGDVSHAGTDLETYNGAYWRDLALPWGGLFGTPRDLARFAGAFLPGPDAPRLLSPAGVALMTADHAAGVPGGIESAKVRWPTAFWGLGWEVKGAKRRHWTGELTSPRTFGHWGYAGTLLWADPERDLALAVFANRSTTHLWPFVPPRWARLSNALVAASE
jgi:CubicO group peptidase (beta-lactamase class C family)